MCRWAVHVPWRIAGEKRQAISNAQYPADKQ